MLLSDRLMNIAQLVEQCDYIADIGTDHGYIPIYLIKNKICKHAIASDINKGPVEKAKKNIRLEGLETSIECRLGGGLSTLQPGEVQGVVVAGMGGHLIKEILEDGRDVFKQLSFAILQPVQHVEVLRKYLYESGFTIEDEALSFDEDKFYEIIKVKWGVTPTSLENIFYEISPILIKKKHPLLRSFIKHKMDKNEKIISTILEDGENSNIRKKELFEKNIRMKEILECL